MIKQFVGLLTGVVFGLGLAVSEMMNPEKVLNFLDIAGNWDPSLAFVMGGAVAVTLFTFRFILKLPAPLFGERFEIPGSQDIDKPLLAGATIFGIGWGISGYCPGPAIAALSIGSIEPWLFVAAFIAGNSLSIWLDSLRQRAAPAQA